MHKCINCGKDFATGIGSICVHCVAKTLKSLRAENKTLLASIAELVGELPGSSIAADTQKAAIRGRDILAENKTLRSWKAEAEEQHHRVMEEKCPTDERHCTCVPILRTEIKQLKEFVSRRGHAGCRVNERRRLGEIEKLNGRIRLIAWDRDEQILESKRRQKRIIMLGTEIKRLGEALRIRARTEKLMATENVELRTETEEIRAKNKLLRDGIQRIAITVPQANNYPEQHEKCWRRIHDKARALSEETK